MSSPSPCTMPWTDSPTGPRWPPRCDPLTKVAWATCSSASLLPPCPGEESQRRRIASRLRSSQHGALYVFDEPSTGLHPLDVATLVGVFDRLLDAGGTIIVIDHDLGLLSPAAQL